MLLKVLRGASSLLKSVRYLESMVFLPPPLQLLLRIKNQNNPFFAKDFHLAFLSRSQILYKAQIHSSACKYERAFHLGPGRKKNVNVRLLSTSSHSAFPPLALHHPQSQLALDFSEHPIKCSGHITHRVYLNVIKFHSHRHVKGSQVVNHKCK